MPSAGPALVQPHEASGKYRSLATASSTAESWLHYPKPEPHHRLALDPMHAPAANPFEDKFEESPSRPRCAIPDISEVEDEISLSPPRHASWLRLQAARRSIGRRSGGLSAGAAAWTWLTSVGPKAAMLAGGLRAPHAPPAPPPHARSPMQTSMQCGRPRRSQKSPAAREPASR